MEDKLFVSGMWLDRPIHTGSPVETIFKRFLYRPNEVRVVYLGNIRRYLFFLSPNAKMFIFRYLTLSPNGLEAFLAWPPVEKLSSNVMRPILSETLCCFLKDFLDSIERPFQH